MKTKSIASADPLPLPFAFCRLPSAFFKEVEKHAVKLFRRLDGRVVARAGDGDFARAGDARGECGGDVLEVPAVEAADDDERGRFDLFEPLDGRRLGRLRQPLAYVGVGLVVVD